MDASLSTVNLKLFSCAMVSKMVNPILCRVFSYSSPIFPKPTIRNLLILQNYENKKPRGNSSGFYSVLRKDYFLAAGFAAAAAAGVAAAGVAVFASSAATARVT